MPRRDAIPSATYNAGSGKKTAVISSTKNKIVIPRAARDLGFKKATHVLGVLALSLFLLGATDQAKRFDKLGHELMCACGCRQILLECNHVGCSYSTAMRQELQTLLGSGDSDPLVLQAFVQKYGPTVLAAPTTTGFNLWAWIMPFLVFALGVAGAGWFVRNWHRRFAAAPAAAGSRRLDSFRERARQETDL